MGGDWEMQAIYPFAIRSASLSQAKKDASNERRIKAGQCWSDLASLSFRDGCCEPRSALPSFRRLAASLSTPLATLVRRSAELTWLRALTMPRHLSHMNAAAIDATCSRVELGPLSKKMAIVAIAKLAAIRSRAFQKSVKYAEARPKRAEEMIWMISPALEDLACPGGSHLPWSISLALEDLACPRRT